MEKRNISVLSSIVFSCLIFTFSLFNTSISQVTDTTKNIQPIYDPFGPENSPDHSGQGSGGVLTPSPYEDIIQTYYTRISADYTGVQYMLDCPLQLALGISWAAYENDIYGLLFKARSTGFKNVEYNQVLERNVPYYILPIEASFDYSVNDKIFQALKLRLNWISYTKSLGMAGIGVLVSKGNLMVGRELPMNRKWEAELTWIQVSGGYIMPLSPRIGGVNAAICAAVDLVGFKYQDYHTIDKKFYGLKVGSIGWLAGVGWNAFTLFNLSLYVGGEWGFSTGALVMSKSHAVLADISRNTLFLGLQGTGRYLNVVGGIQKEWESLDYQKSIHSEKSLRYYFGFNYYIRR
jgi:hypothetical protein